MSRVDVLTMRVMGTHVVVLRIVPECNVEERYQHFEGTAASTFRLEVYSQVGRADTHTPHYTNPEHYDVQIATVIELTHSLQKHRQIRRLV
jgi:hypothetical protein